ncbi:hypothetical protein ACSSWA_10710 [Melioribacter sp. Ez-97]|uniref:hypothetical protein n=1 Tax=Melioribacter sp. Ez-97 TaxID=3423434 RepID=UPI003EDA9526
MRLLVFEYSNDVRKIISKQIELINSGADVILIRNLYGTVKELSKSSFDIVIIDGDSTEGELKKVIELTRSKNKDAVIILLTSYDIPILRKRFFDLGINYNFDKLTEFDSFLKILRTVITDIDEKEKNKAV